MIPVPVIAFLKSPLFKYIAVVLAVAAILFGAYRFGAHSVQLEWDAAKAETDKEIAELKEKAGKITTVEVIKYVDRIKIVEGKTRTVTEYVDKYVTVEVDKQCTIPKNVITILDAAAKGIKINPEDVK